MSKAVLVLVEMPKRCADCELCEQIPSGDDSYTEYFCNVIHCGEQVKTKVAEKKRADFCPMREMPPKTEVYPEESGDEWSEGYVTGYNACLKDIEGERRR